MAETIRTLSEYAGELLTELSTVFEHVNQTEELLHALGWAAPPGLDDIGLTLRHTGEITSFEEIRPVWLPRILPV